VSRLVSVLTVTLVATFGCLADPSEAARGSATEEQTRTTTSDTDDETTPTSSDLPDDRRIYFLHLDRGTSFHRQLRHDDSVDVWAVFDREGLERTYGTAGVRGAPGSRYDDPIAMQLLQRIVVMRVDSRHDADGMTIGLGVTLEEARLLDIAQRFGHLSLALRGPEDVEISPLTTRRLESYAGSLDSLRIHRQRRLEHYRSRAEDNRPLAERLPKQADPEQEDDGELEIVRDGDDDSYRDWERGRALFVPTDIPLEAVSVGDRIDIQATFAGSDPLAGSDNRRDVGHVLLQGVEVLDVPERESADGLVIELLDEEIALLLLAARRGELTTTLRPRRKQVSNQVDTRNLDDERSELAVVLGAEPENPRDEYKQTFYSDAADGVCAEYGRCLDEYDLSAPSAPQGLALVGPEGVVQETGLLYADSEEYPEAAGRCIRNSLQSVTLPAPPQLRSVYLRCRADLTPDIIRGDGAGRSNSSNDSREMRADVYFVTHGHYPPSLGEKFRKVFE
jgi:Flp pilus assembly protein CpaB